MGAKNAKNAKNAPPKPTKSGKPGKPSVVPPKQPEATEADFDFLVTQTGLSKAEIKGVFEKFNANNPDHVLDKKEFVALYSSLRYEPPERLDEISEFVFNVFDSDKNGSISFSEFMIAYALTSRGDLKKKLEYAFVLYDADGNGYLDSNEVRDVVNGMLDLLGADRKHNNPKELAAECMKELDASHDGKVTKEEFVNALLKNFSLRALMNPFG